MRQPVGPAQTPHQGIVLRRLTSEAPGRFGGPLLLAGFEGGPNRAQGPLGGIGGAQGDPSRARPSQQPATTKGSWRVPSGTGHLHGAAHTGDAGRAARRIGGLGSPPTQPDRIQFPGLAEPRRKRGDCRAPGPGGPRTVTRPGSTARSWRSPSCGGPSRRWRQALGRPSAGSQALGPGPPPNHWP